MGDSFSSYSAMEPEETCSRLEVWKTRSLPLVTRRFAFLLALLLLLGMA